MDENGIFNSRPSWLKKRLDALETVAVAPEIYRVPDKTSIGLFWVLILLIALSIIWSITSYLDEVAFCQGRVIPSSQVQLVQNLEGGILAEMLVTAGDVVQEGDVLARLDATAVGASVKGDTVLLQGHQAKEARLVAEAEGKVPDFKGMDVATSFFENEQQSYNARQQTLMSEKTVLQNQLQQRKTELREIQANTRKMQSTLGSINKEIEMTRPMVEKGITAQVELLYLERAANDIRGDINIGNKSDERMRASIAEAKNRIRSLNLDFQAAAREELSKVRIAISALTQEMAVEQDRVKRTIIKAPLSGIVKRVYVNTVGGVVRAGETFIELVPTGENLVVEVRIDPKDIGFIHEGQPAQVRLTAYDSSIYGAMSATVQRVGADSITEETTGDIYYSGYVETQNQYVGNNADELPILPGMLADVSIITGRRTVMDYFLKPIRRIKERALREP